MEADRGWRVGSRVDGVIVTEAAFSMEGRFTFACYSKEGKKEAREAGGREEGYKAFEMLLNRKGP